MKILQCINALTWGGAQTLLLDLCRFLRDAGHSVRVAAFRDGPLGEALRRSGVGVEILGEVCLDLAAFLRLRRLVRDWQPAVVHSHLFRATFWARMATRGRKGPALITSVHGFESEGFHRLERRMACRSRVMVFPSRFLRDWYAEQIRPLPPGRQVIIHPGAAVRAPAPAHPFGDPPLIGTLARLHPVKGMDTLVTAAGRLREKGKAFRLVIGGEGKELTRLVTMIDTHHLTERTSLVGSISSRETFLEGLDLFVAPSREEAFGISICEAMERGVPVVASTVGGIPEIIRDGIDGRLVPPDDPERLAAVLEDLLDRPADRHRLAEAGRTRIATDFPREPALQKHLEVYSRFAPEPRRLHFAVSSGELGGGERVALSLARTLALEGWRITFTCGGEPLSGQLRAAGGTGSDVSMKAGGLFFLMRLWRDLARSGARLVSAHLNRAALAAGLLARIRPLFVAAHVHGLNRVVYYRDCHRLIAVSAAVRDHLTGQGMPPERVELLPNCIPFPPVAVARPPGPPWTIAITAKLHANKGHAWALDALAAHLPALPKFRLWILGDGPERRHLETLVRSGPLGERTTFWGFQEDLDRFYPEIHLALLPSLGEGIPLSLLEAMRWGIPCVATRVGGIPEVVTDGQNGHLIEPFDGKALADAVRGILEPARWAALSERAREQFVAKNRFDAMLARFRDILFEGDPDGP